MIYWAESRATKQAAAFPELVRPSTKWHGQRGMRWGQLMPKMEQLLQREPPPAKLIIHLGGNDIPATPIHKLVRQIREDLEKLRKWMPATQIVWSDLTARLRYRYARDHAKVDKARKTVNYKIHVTVCQLGGSFIKHPAITCDDSGQFRPDGVHLSDPGNDNLLQDWLDNIKGLIQ